MNEIGICVEFSVSWKFISHAMSCYTPNSSKDIIGTILLMVIPLCGRIQSAEQMLLKIYKENISENPGHTLYSWSFQNVSPRTKIIVHS